MRIHRFCCPAGASFSERSLGKSLYYYPFLSSRAATILWGRLVTCGGLSIRLPAASTMPENRSKSLRLAAMRGRLQPAFSITTRPGRDVMNQQLLRKVDLLKIKGLSEQLPESRLLPPRITQSQT